MGFNEHYEEWFTRPSLQAFPVEGTLIEFLTYDNRLCEAIMHLSYYSSTAGSYGMVKNDQYKHRIHLQNIRLAKDAKPTAKSNLCECGAHSTGIRMGGAGHSSWCPAK